MNNSITLPEVDQRDRVRRSTFIADSIKKMIADGQLKPGDRVPTEEKLCQHFAVSRTTLRESIQMLRVSGLLEVTPGRGSYVRMPNMQNILDDFGMMSHYHNVKPQDISFALVAMMQDVVARACHMSHGAKKGLQKYALNPQLPAQENLEMEAKWLDETVALLNNAAYKVLFTIALGLAKSWRCKNMEDENEVTRLCGLQIKLNNAILEGDEALAKRLVASYFMVLPAQQGLTAA